MNQKQHQFNGYFKFSNCTFLFWLTLDSWQQVQILTLTCMKGNKIKQGLLASLHFDTLTIHKSATFFSYKTVINKFAIHTSRLSFFDIKTIANSNAYHTSTYKPTGCGNLGLIITYTSQ